MPQGLQRFALACITAAYGCLASGLSNHLHNHGEHAFHATDGPCGADTSNESGESHNGGQKSGKHDCPTCHLLTTGTAATIAPWIAFSPPANPPSRSAVHAEIQVHAVFEHSPSSPRAPPTVTNFVSPSEIRRVDSQA